jgi:hypothetical protein
MSSVKSSPSCLTNLVMLKAKEFRRLQEINGSSVETANLESFGCLSFPVPKFAIFTLFFFPKPMFPISRRFKLVSID